jgi:para-nitrobenzyl esterase
VYLVQIIKTDKGYVSGTTIGKPGNEVSIFRGIPFAAPPVGELRWKPPQPAVPWDDIRECTKFSAISPQMEMPGMPSPLPLSEDCLYLNVLTPARQPNEKLPVMVWMHGGMYALGSGNDALSNHYQLPQQGIVLVTVNMRLDVIGLLAHPLLSAESPHGVSSNYMFLDMIAALQWVQRNIAAFGGDPKNVTIFGESGGGAKVSTLISSPLTKGLYHKAICESGTATARTWWTGQSLESLEALGERIFDKLGVKTLEAARAVPYIKFYEANVQLTQEIGSQWGVVDVAVDGWFLTDSPLNIYRAGKMNPVPLINCANAGELTAMFPMLVPGYVEMFSGMEKAGTSSYACIFDQVPVKWRQEGMMHAPHGLELLYVFGDYDNTTGWWEMTYSMMSMMGSPLKSKAPGLTEIDKYISESMMRYWTQFARTGNPNGIGLPDWPAYTAVNNSYMYINETFEVKTGFSEISK